jgi:hypothetical protein
LKRFFPAHSLTTEIAIDGCCGLAIASRIGITESFGDLPAFAPFRHPEPVARRFAHSAIETGGTVLLLGGRPGSDPGGPASMRVVAVEDGHTLWERALPAGSQVIVAASATATDPGPPDLPGRRQSGGDRAAGHATMNRWMPRTFSCTARRWAR